MHGLEVRCDKVRLAARVWDVDEQLAPGSRPDPCGP
jgi:hypothetical protein